MLITGYIDGVKEIASMTGCGMKYMRLIFKAEMLSFSQKADFDVKIFSLVQTLQLGVHWALNPIIHAR